MTIPINYDLPVQEKKEFDLLPIDNYQVEITKIDLLENVPVYMKPDETEDKFKFEFTIVEEGAYKGRKQWLEVRTAMSAGNNGLSPSWLYKIFCAVNNVKLGDDEAKSVTAGNINEMEGKQLRITVKQQISAKGKEYNKVTDVLPLKGATEVAGKIDKLEENIGTPKGEDVDVEGIPF